MNPPDPTPYEGQPGLPVSPCGEEPGMSDGGCAATLLTLWIVGGGMLYAGMFLAPQGLDSNIWQRIFVAVLCGPLAWLMVIYEMLGMIE